MQTLAPSPTATRTRTLEPIEIRIHGVSERPVRFACDLLTAVYRRLGRDVLALRGADRLAATVRVAGDGLTIGRSDVVLVLDPTLLTSLSPAALGSAARVIVNAPGWPCSRLPGALRVVPVDATGIAERRGGRSVALPMIGALAGATGLIPLDVLLAAVEEMSGPAASGNVAACGDGYEEVAEALPR